MAQEHLSTDRLLAIQQRDFGDSEALEHLAACPDCRRTFDDTRWFLLLKQLPQILESGPHPGRDEILAYHTYALASPRMAEIERHLESCRHCLSRVSRARAAERATAYRSPSPKLLRAVQLGFRPSRKLRRLGTLVVRRLDEGLGLEFIPLRIAEAGAPRARARRGAAHPGSALGRLRRLMELKAREEAKTEEAQAVFLSAPIAEERLIGAAEPRPLRVAVGRHQLILLPVSADDGSYLSVQVVRGESEDPAAGIGLRLTGKSGDTARAVTDDAGLARLPLPRQAHELVVDLEHPLALALLVLD